MKAHLVGILFAVAWLAFVTAFDGWIGYNIWRQMRALDFATVEGRVLSSKVTSHHGESTTYGVAIRYAYTVQDQTYEGDNFRYGAGSTSDDAWARQAVRAHRAGQPVAVHYDPAQPSDSVLQPGLEGYDLFLLLFLTPFNLIGLLLLSYLVSLCRRRPSPVAVWRQDGPRLHVRLEEFSPWLFGFGTMGLAAFGAIFVVGFGFGGFHPRMTVMLVTWATVLALGLGVGLRHWRRLRNGVYDLVLDRIAGTVDLPPRPGRRRRLVLALGRLRAVVLASVLRRKRRSGDLSDNVLSLQLDDGTTEEFATRSDPGEARAFARWLGERMQLPLDDAKFVAREAASSSTLRP